MIIGVDCDGVLTDMSEFIFCCGEKFFKRKPDDPSGYTTAQIFACSEKEELLFGLKYFFGYCKSWPPREGAVSAVKELNEAGHILYQITARKFTR